MVRAAIPTGVEPVSNAVAFLFLFSFGLAFGYSLLRHPIIQYSTLFFVFPLLLLFFFSFTPNVFRQGTGLVLVVVLVLLGGGVSTALEKKFFRMPAYGVFKELADRTRVWSVDAPKPAVVVLNVINPDYLDYYFDQADWKPERVIYRPETAGELARLMVTLDSLQPQSVIYGWTNSFHPEELYFLLRERWPIMDQDEAFSTHEFPGFVRARTSGQSRVPGPWCGISNRTNRPFTFLIPALQKGRSNE